MSNVWNKNKNVYEFLTENSLKMPVYIIFGDNFNRLRFLDFELH